MYFLKMIYNNIFVEGIYLAITLQCVWLQCGFVICRDTMQSINNCLVTQIFCYFQSVLAFA